MHNNASAIVWGKHLIQYFFCIISFKKYGYTLLEPTGKGFRQYGYLKNICSASFLLINKNKLFKTFPKAHIAENHC
jgi:hypothetical protein